MVESKEILTAKLVHNTHDAVYSVYSKFPFFFLNFQYRGMFSITHHIAQC